MGTVTEDLIVRGSVITDDFECKTADITNAMCSANMELARTKLALDSNTEFNVPLTDFRIHDAPQTAITGTPGTDDLGLKGTAFGTNSMYLSAGDLKAAGATTRYARVHIPIPAEYASAETCSIVLNVGMLTTVSDTTCTCDVEAYESDHGSGISADLCTTAATDMNSLTFAEKTFALTATALSSGDSLDVRVAVICNDAATGTTVEPVIGAVKLVCDVRG